ncbi:MAG: FAD-binding protein [Caldilineaceae bacterium]|nr:FAD-binding protein [Caldilineaceae bacterium]
MAADVDAVADSRELVAELKRVVTGEVRFDGYSRMLYSTDASLYQIQPVGVVIPRRIEDVIATMEAAARYGLPVLPRGGGSSLAGQAVGAAVVMDFSKYMNQVLDVQPEARQVTVEPGINFAALNRQLARHGLMIGPDPASGNRATIGGSIGNNASGSHSILYGMMADSVHSVGAVLADASLAEFGPLDAAGIAARAGGTSLEAQIYRRVPAIVHDVMDEILAGWPKHWRRASGYNLDRLAAALLPPDQRSRLSFDSRFRPPVADPARIERFNLAQLLTGSEGTLAVMTAATVNLVPRPRRTGLAVIHFDDLIASCAAITDILETDPSAAELLDKHLLDLARAQPEWARRLHFVEGDPAAVMLTEFYGADEAEVRQKLDRLDAHMRARGYRGAIVHVLDPARQADVWEVRKAGLNILNSRRGEYKPVPGIEDVSVPQENLADYMEQLLDFLGQEPGDIPGVSVYAHASAGCLHVRPLMNMKTERGVELLNALGDYACGLAVGYHGAMSGEHGDGLARSELNPRIFGPALYQALVDVKAAFDPDNRMNPGKIVHAPPRGDNLRFGPGYQTIQLDAVFDWSADGGYAPAVEMCNGAGVCRKVETGTMCPSFMATRDERDSTRGRANALRNALAGRIPREELFAPEMKEVMGLCLGCKACKSECPSAVDMAKIKAEYMVHYHRVNGTPLFNRLMGLLPTLDGLLFRLGKPMIPAVNGVIASPLMKQIQARIGVHPRRTLPRYAPETLEEWFGREIAGRLPAEAALSLRNPVILFHDTWTNFNETEVGKAAVRVLQAGGYDVYLAQGRKCCGRPLITGGQADKAKPWIDHNVALLAPYAQQGVPIVGVEPSCILTLRDEYLNLAADKRRARLVAGQAFTFEEFVSREMEADRFHADWRGDAGKALLHGHCHHKAMVGNNVTVTALRGAGYDVEVIPSGCCGMAGDFGYEKAHYEVSRTIGEDRLLPAVRAAADDVTLVASGTSCRHQIHDFTDRQAIHLAEALARAIRY